MQTLNIHHSILNPYFYHLILIISINNNKAIITPREEEKHYKTAVTIPNLEYFNDLLIEYINFSFYYSDYKVPLCPLIVNSFQLIFE